MKVITYTDGGSRGNPGPAASGVFISSQEGEQLTSFGTYLGIQTNNFAEYTAIVEALSWVLDHKEALQITEVECRMDSQLACRQLSGQYKVKHPQVRLLFEKVRLLQLRIAVPFRFIHVPREQNALADREVNNALDKHKDSSIQ